MRLASQNGTSSLSAAGGGANFFRQPRRAEDHGERSLRTLANLAGRVVPKLGSLVGDVRCSDKIPRKGPAEGRNVLRRPGGLCAELPRPLRTKDGGGRASGEWNEDDYDVLIDGTAFSARGPQEISAAADRTAWLGM
jgi:hypothetical protein